MGTLSKAKRRRKGWETLGRGDLERVQHLGDKETDYWTEATASKKQENVVATTLGFVSL